MQTTFARSLRWPYRGSFQTSNSQPLNSEFAVAIFHLSVKTVSRSAGRSATAAAAYRAGAEITDERTGEIHDYARKAGVESAELFLPANAPQWASDRERLWNSVEQSEKRKNSTVAREFEVALPSELSVDQRKELAHEFTRALVEKYGFAADCAIHLPGKEGDSKNHHAHILCSTRKLTAEGFTEKTRELDDRATGATQVVACRELFATMTNTALERAGQAERVDHRSLEAQGIDREPTIHLGPTATAIERRGKVSEKTQRHQERQAEAVAKVAALVAIAEAAAGKAAQKTIDELTKITKEIEDDRVRNQAIDSINVNVAASRRSGSATDRALAFTVTDHAGISQSLGAATANFSGAQSAVGTPNQHLETARAARTGNIGAVRASASDLGGAQNNLWAAGKNLGGAIEGAKRRVAERHYGRVVEAARSQFNRAGGIVQQAADRIEHVVRSVATAAYQVAQQAAAKLELRRQQAAAKTSIDPRSAYHPDNIAKREAREAAAAAAQPAPRVKVPDRPTKPVEQVKPAPRPLVPELNQEEAKARLLQASTEIEARWDAALLAERALYLKELTAEAYAKAVAHVAEHQAHIDAKPLLFGRDKWEIRRLNFERRDDSNNLSWRELKEGRYPFVVRDTEAVQEAVERRVSDKNPELAQTVPKAAAVLQVERQRLAAESQAQYWAERQRKQEAYEMRRASGEKDLDRGGPSR